MDLSFSNHALCAEWVVKNQGLKVKVHDVPSEIADGVAQLKLDSMGVKIDSLSEEQEKYLKGWEEGT